MEEKIPQKVKAKVSLLTPDDSFRMVKPARLSEVTLNQESRLKTGVNEFDRVLGGGLVQGSLTLLAPRAD